MTLEQAIEYALSAGTYWMPSLPTGTVTFLFTDIARSTTLLQCLGDQRYAGDPSPVRERNVDRRLKA